MQFLSQCPLIENSTFELNPQKLLRVSIRVQHGVGLKFTFMKKLSALFLNTADLIQQTYLFFLTKYHYYFSKHQYSYYFVMNYVLTKTPTWEQTGTIVRLAKMSTF